MKAYILSVIGAAVLASFAGILAPDRWRKYIGVITGMVIISCIIAPISSITRTELFRGFDEVEELQDQGGDIQTDMVREELEKRVAEDIEKRLAEEFGKNMSAGCRIKINSNNEIEGVEEIYIYGSIGAREKERLKEVYGTENITSVKK